MTERSSIRAPAQDLTGQEKLHETIAASSHRFPLFSCQIQSPCLAADVVRPAPAATRSKFLLALRKKNKKFLFHLLICSFSARGGCVAFFLTTLLNPVCAAFFIHTNTHTTKHNKSCDLPSHPSGSQCGLHSACRTDYFYHNVPLLFRSIINT